MVRVGLVGCGTIGSQLALALQRHYAAHARITALHDSNLPHARALQRRLRSHPPLVTLPELIRRSDLVCEAASVAAGRLVLRRALAAGKDVLIMSVGALLSEASWRTRARRRNARVYVPSGALAGLDGIRAMAAGRITRVTLTTRKPPAALGLAGLTRPRTVFQGGPAEAVKAFPQNTNVAAALALSAGAGRSRPRVRVTVVADPSVRRNTHEVEVEGDAGLIRCRIESRPSANPKTSLLAVRSAAATLDRIFNPVQLGT